MKRFTPLTLVLFFTIFVMLVGAIQTRAAIYTTIDSGPWNDPTNWLGSAVPPMPGGVNPAGDTINIHHVISFNIGGNINNHGILRIQGLVSIQPAWLQVPTNTKVDNFLGGEMYVIDARLLQCRFVSCNNGEPYAGNSPQAVKNDGVWTNQGGKIDIIRSVVEVAQSWVNTKEGSTRGERRIIESCVFTGQNFQVSDAIEEIRHSLISLAWHGSGNFQVSNNSTITYEGADIQIAGLSGNFSQSSSVTHSGDIDYIALRNQVGGFIGSGEIKNDSGMPGGPVALDFYCVQNASKYIPGGEFTGSQLPNCSLGLDCGNLVPTAASVSVDGRVMTADGLGIGGVFVTVTGGDLDEPLRSMTNPFGFYSFPQLDVGHTYILEVSSKRYQFANPTRVINLDDTLTGIDFVADGPSVFVAPSVMKKRGTR